MMAVRDDIVWRSGIVYFTIVLLASALLIRIVILQYVQHGKWYEMSEKFVYKKAEIPANRGDILSYDGRLLASSVPYYTPALYVGSWSEWICSAERPVDVALETVD